jgi:hypothetical protein
MDGGSTSVMAKKILCQPQIMKEIVEVVAVRTSFVVRG